MHGRPCLVPSALLTDSWRYAKTMMMMMMHVVKHLWQSCTATHTLAVTTSVSQPHAVTTMSVRTPLQKLLWVCVKMYQCVLVCTCVRELLLRCKCKQGSVISLIAVSSSDITSNRLLIARAYLCPQRTQSPQQRHINTLVACLLRCTSVVRR